MTPKPRHPHQLVVVGTDTDVGKTVISALVVQGLSAHYWKPVQCGDRDIGGDTGRVANLCGLSEAERKQRLLAEGSLVITAQVLLALAPSLRRIVACTASAQRSNNSE